MPVDGEAAPCVFCDPGSGEILGETTSWWIRLDNFPAAPGHVLLIPKRHVVSVFELNGAEAAESDGVRLYARELVAVRFGMPHGWTIGINEGRAAGRSVDHVHEHMIPRHLGDVPDPCGGLRRVLPNGDPDAWRVPAAPTVRLERPVRWCPSGLRVHSSHFWTDGGPLHTCPGVNETGETR